MGGMGAGGLGYGMGLGAMGMGMGGAAMGGVNMGMLPLAYALNPSASLSPTDAAALGMQAQPSNTMGNNLNMMLANPMVAPMLYGSPGMSGNTMAGMMFASQAQSMGFGSGQLSGVRPVAAVRPGGPAAKPKARGSASTPGGLAANYFNRRNNHPLSSKLLQPAKSLLPTAYPIREFRLFSI